MFAQLPACPARPTRHVWRAVVVLGLFVSCCCFQVATQPASAQEPTELDAAVALENKLVEAIATAERSVVAIARVRRSEDRDALEQSGFPGAPPAPTDPNFVPNEYASGVVIDAAGLILTAYHVLGDPEENDYYVWLNRVPHKAVKVQATMAGDPWMDLAVLKIEAENLEPIRFGDAGQLKKGQIVIALGNPMGIARDGQASASWGIISNLSRKAIPRPAADDTDVTAETLHQYGTLIQVDARLNLGVSGGALVNLKGEMIGLLTSLAAGPTYDSAAGFAIPVDENFQRTVETLKTGRRADYGFLGVLPWPLTREERQRGLRGARVHEVVRATPAARAKIEPEDIVLAVNNTPIFDDSDLIRTVSALPPDSVVELAIDRNGRTITQRVTLSKKRLSPARQPYFTAADPIWRGMKVDYATALPSFYLQSAQFESNKVAIGVLEVDPDSPAWAAGIRAGDYIVEVGRHSVSTPGDFFESVEKLAGSVAIEVLSGGARQLRTVQP